MHVTLNAAIMFYYSSYSSFKHSCNVRSNNKTINSDFTFQTAYRSWKNKIDELGFYSGFAYDAIVAMALALNSSAQILAKRNKSLDEFTYKDAEMAQIFKDSLSNVKFLGFSVKPFVCFPLNRGVNEVGALAGLCCGSTPFFCLAWSQNKTEGLPTSASREVPYFLD